MRVYRVRRVFPDLACRLPRAYAGVPIVFFFCCACYRLPWRSQPSWKGIRRPRRTGIPRRVLSL